MKVRIVSVNDAVKLSKFYLENENHLRNWEPLREQGYHSVAAWEQRLRVWQHAKKKGDAIHFVSTATNDNEIIAICSLTNIVRGPFMACNMGYAVASKYEGKGLMKRLCQYAINYAFNELELNRVMANYMPSNARSAMLLKGLGFRIEGVAKRYLKINGAWEDHVLTSVLNLDHAKKIN